jgi:hypothetical protein
MSGLLIGRESRSPHASSAGQAPLDRRATESNVCSEDRVKRRRPYADRQEVDRAHDFLFEAPYGAPGTTELLPAMSALTAGFRAARRPVVHIVRLYHPDGRDADLVRRGLLADGAALVAPGGAGSAIPAELLPPDAPSLDSDLLLAGGPQPSVASALRCCTPSRALCASRPDC